MQRIILSFLLVVITTVSEAQIPVGRSNQVTLFPEYQKAAILLSNGKLNNQSRANIFMKNSTLVYYSGDKIMEAEMKLIQNVKIGDRFFLNCNNQLSEVIAEEGDNKLLCVRLIDQDAMRSDYLNESTVTNISINDQVGVTRLEPGEDAISYPLIDNYYYLVNGKRIPAHERYVQSAIKRGGWEQISWLVNSSFHWNDKEDLKKLLKEAPWKESKKK